MAKQAKLSNSAKAPARGRGAHNKARIIAVVGASGTGKGRYCKGELLPALVPPFLVWSPLEATDNYAKVLKGESTKEFVNFLQIAGNGGPAIFVPPLDGKRITQRFEWFCRAAWEFHGATVLVEELSRVTTASYAPAAWKNLSTAGRHQGLTLIGTCQRPAQVDKDFFGNCTEIRCFRLNYKNDARVMAGVLRVPWADLMELPDGHYVHRHMSDRKNTLGVLK